MKITIDTKEDSPEAIRKAIELLSHALGESPKPGFQNIFSNAQEASAEPSLQEPTNAFSAMFGGGASPALNQESTDKPNTTDTKDQPTEDEKEIAKRIQIIDY